MGEKATVKNRCTQGTKWTEFRGISSQLTFEWLDSLRRERVGLTSSWLDDLTDLQGIHLEKEETQRDKDFKSFYDILEIFVYLPIVYIYTRFIILSREYIIF